MAQCLGAKYNNVIITVFHVQKWATEPATEFKSQSTNTTQEGRESSAQTLKKSSKEQERSLNTKRIRNSEEEAATPLII